ncbi:MAG: hypothetical protein DMF93_14110 [Acidobacteria bacterium]|nr:MAG: hypothetical protein DMF93_14110 [Acidobacteriota bacterium]
MASSVGRRSIPLAIVVVVSLVAPGPARAQGFGVFKKNVMLARSLPPVIDLSGTRVGVNVTGVPGRPQTVTQLLRAKLIPLIFSNGTLVESQASPDRVVEVTITDLRSTTRIDPADRSTVVTANIQAAYRTINNQTKRTLDAKNVDFEYEQRFAAAQQQTQTATTKGSDGGFLGKLNKLSNSLGSGAASTEQPPTAEKLTMMMVDAIAVQIAQRIVLMKETIEVPLPRGKLDKASDLAVNGRWGAMLEQLEQTSPLPAADDAYRIYGIGVANEALAYLERDAAKQRDLVANASLNYKNALQVRRDEKTFQKAEARIAQSLNALTVVAAQQSQSRAPAVQPAGGARSAGGEGGGKATRWNNAAVVELAKGGFKDSELVEMIATAPTPEFEVSTPADLLELRRAGLSDVVIRVMRIRMQSVRKDR